jgi:esterase/lipase superfamily enzyme
VLFAVHGFNVSFEYGARSLARLEPQIGLGPSDVFFGVLWPGDYWIPAVNYPFEGEVSTDCGRRLADFCRRWLNRAQSISFVSHSLGARLVLEAVKNLDGQARVVCLTAAAISKDSLSTQYAGATAKASAVSILASHHDWVLGVAYRVGDPIAEILDPDHTPFQPALGYDGPPTPTYPPIASPWQIPNDADYGHHDYLPPGDAAVNDKWLLPAGFMARAFQGQTQTWP